MISRIRKREIGLDLLKGTAVVLMLLAHTIAVTYKGTDSSLISISKFADIVCFTTFLFASGASVYIAYLKHTIIDDANIPIRIINRVLFLVLGYYLATFASALGSFPSDISGIIKYVFDLLFFIKIPEYTEFLIPFMFYTLSIIPFKKAYKLIANSVLSAIFIGAVLFYGGVLMYEYLPDSQYKLFFSGQGEEYAFPVIQYSIVFFMGLSFGKWLIENKVKYKRRLLSLGTAIGLGLALLVLNLMPFSSLVNDQSMRWPPSLSFILLGLIFSYIMSSLLEIEVPQTGRFSFVTRKLSYCGRYVFAFYIIHIIILQFYSLIWGRKFQEPIYSILAFVGLISATYIVNRFLEMIMSRKKVKVGVNSEKKSTGIKVKLLVFLVFLLSISGATRIAIYLGTSSADSEITTTNRLSENRNKNGRISWWDNNFSWRKKVVLNNNLTETINKEEMMYFVFDHSSLVRDGKSLENGADIHLIYLVDGDEEVFEDLPIKLASINSENTQIIFQPFREVAANQNDSNYYLYYDNDQAYEYRAMGSLANSDTPIEIQVEISDARHHPNFLNVNRSWYLKGGEVLKEESNINIKFTPEEFSSNNVYKYGLIGTRIEGTMVRKLSGYEADLDTSEIEPGIYNMQIVSTNKDVASNVITINVSYPLYVLWTMDWEGYDCKQEYLDMINNLSDKYNVPITQFYNPRIYVGLSKSRQDYLDNWIKTRQARYGDEVELHLHMFHDMVAATGVKVRTGPKWTNYTDGKDVLATAYTRAEFEIILNWAKNKFIERGFGDPIAFRAGAWYADESTLQALENTGFSIDSSGREKYIWGTNNVPGYWDLKSTTVPYKPSMYDQNIAGSPSFDLYEFPNNGADSWTYSAEQMLSRFKDNYKDGPMLYRQAVTYLSHPHAFNVDAPKIDEIFAYIDQRTFRTDSGPVKFVTMKDAYIGWLNEKGNL